jgi:plasmid stability protein
VTTLQQRHGSLFGGERDRRRACNATILKPKWFISWSAIMPTTLTLKGIPDDVYAQLKAAAEVHRRSLNSEVIACLENALLPRRISASERVARARALRAQLKPGAFVPAEIDAFPAVTQALPGT